MKNFVWNIPTELLQLHVSLLPQPILKDGKEALFCKKKPHSILLWQVLFFVFRDTLA